MAPVVRLVAAASVKVNLNIISAPTLIVQAKGVKVVILD